jgi:hypothetical protein
VRLQLGLAPLRVCWGPHTDFSKARGHLELSK